MFAKIIYNRIQPLLDQEQASEQMGFRPNSGTDDATIVFEGMAEKAIEWNLEIWVVSIDLRKAFDRVEYNTLFNALSEQGLPPCYIHLLDLLYRNQHGTVNASRPFPIARGVRQGDVLSPLLFNAALESVIRKWKARLRNHGWQLSELDAQERLTNVRYADDLLIFGKSLPEVSEMIEILGDELSKAGLSINGTKTKIMTTNSEAISSTSPILVDMGDFFVEVVRRDGCHKYLGRRWSGDLRGRGQCNLEHRLSLAWLKFHNLHKALTNQKVPVRLRLRLFESVVSPTAVYSLGTTPLTTSQLQRLDATQRKMLRRIVGWTRCEDEAWEVTGSRMKQRLSAALAQHPVRAWSEVREANKSRMQQRLAEGMAPALARSVFNWQPDSINSNIRNNTQAYRARARPRQRWH